MGLSVFLYCVLSVTLYCLLFAYSRHSFSLKLPPLPEHLSFDSTGGAAGDGSAPQSTGNGNNIANDGAPCN